MFGLSYKIFADSDIFFEIDADNLGVITVESLPPEIDNTYNDVVKSLSNLINTQTQTMIVLFVFSLIIYFLVRK